MSNARKLRHQMHNRRQTYIAMCISQAEQVNYFPALFSFFHPHALERALWDGCDEMEHKKAIYPLFVPLRSFKRANSLEAALREREIKERDG